MTKIKINRLTNALKSPYIRFFNYEKMIHPVEFYANENFKQLCFRTQNKTIAPNEMEFCMFVHEISHAILATDKQLFKKHSFGLNDYDLLNNLNNFIKLETKVLALELCLINHFCLPDFSKEDLFNIEFSIFKTTIEDVFARHGILDPLDIKIKNLIPENKHLFFDFSKNMFFQIENYLTNGIKENFDSEYQLFKQYNPKELINGLKERVENFKYIKI